MISLGVLVLFGFGCARAVIKTTDETKNSPASSETKIDRTAVLLEAKQQGLIMDTPEIDRMKDISVRVEDLKVQKNSDLKSLLAMDVKKWHAAALADVTGGNSFGLAHTQYLNGRFTLIASLGGLPTTGNGAFYKGWLVRRGDSMSVLETGTVEKIGEQFANAYLSAEDLSLYDFFVITLQTSVEQTEPGEHILEGMIR